MQGSKLTIQLMKNSLLWQQLMRIVFLTSIYDTVNYLNSWIIIFVVWGKNTFSWTRWFMVTHIQSVDTYCDTYLIGLWFHSFIPSMKISMPPRIIMNYNVVVYYSWFVIGQCCNFQGINYTVEISGDILADYRLHVCHRVNNMAMHIIWH